MAQIERSGSVVFHDASIHVWEEPENRGLSEWNEWEKDFKKQVFKRIIQQLNRMGWTVGERDEAERFKTIADNYRTCRKGDLHGHLELSGRHIEFKMWQSVNTPTRPDHGGRYESNKEAIMPYLLRIRMEWTRRRLRDYLCNVFTGYEFGTKKSDGRNNKIGPNGMTALEWVAGCYESSWHFKGDWQSYIEQEKCGDRYRTSGNGDLLDHCQRVWLTDCKGRICTGIAYYNINNMWWVVTGKYTTRNIACFDLYTKCPDNPREKRNSKLKRQRLESELSKAVKAMNFERAAILRDILFQKNEPLFMVWSERNQGYHRTNFSGYATDKVDAGKFTREEMKRYAEDTDSRIEAVA